MRGNDAMAKDSFEGATVDDNPELSRVGNNDRRWGDLNKYSNKSAVDLGVFFITKGDIIKEECDAGVSASQVFGDSWLSVTGVFDIFFGINAGFAMREYEHFKLLYDSNLTVTGLLLCSNGELAKRVLKMLGDSSVTATGVLDKLHILFCINGEFAKRA